MNAWKTARLLPLWEIEWRIHCAKLPPCTSNSCESNFKITIRENVSLKKSSHVILPIAEPKVLRKGELTLSLILQDLYLPLSLDDSDSLGDSMWRRRESRVQMQAYRYNRVLLLQCPTGLLVLSNFYFVVVVTFKNTL